ncbi:MAG: peptidase M23, partial [Campylobacterota bacterium]
MSRLLIIFILANFILEAKTSVDTKIEKTSSEISSISKSHEDINKKMDETAKAIIFQEEEIQKQQGYLKKLKDELQDKESIYEENAKELKGLKSSQDKLKSDGSKLEEELVFTIAQSVSLSIILEAEYSANEESLIEYEVLELMLKDAKSKIKGLNENFHNNSKNIDILNQHVNSLEAAITTIDTKRKEVVKTQEANKELLKNLKIAKDSYKKELQDVLGKQDLLKKTLVQLNIIKVDEINKAKEESERAQAFSAKDKVSDDNLPKVKSVGSSYQAVKTKEYSGEKTIAPFEPYKITKAYGNYTDPIYGIKVFNESISLKPSEKDAKVKTVFNGKVIYA